MGRDCRRFGQLSRSGSLSRSGWSGDRGRPSGVFGEVLEHRVDLFGHLLGRLFLRQPFERLEGGGRKQSPSQ